IHSIENLSDPLWLEKLIAKYPNSFPAGYASYRLTQIYNAQNNSRKAQYWTQYFQKNFPMHPKAQSLFDETKLASMEGKSDAKKIGVLLPLTGKNKDIGRLALNGMSLAVGTFGTSTPHSIELVVEDTESRPDVARQKIK